MMHYEIKADHENNSETWWDALPEGELQSQLRAGESVRVTAAELASLRALPGWADQGAPEHAPHPVLVRERYELVTDQQIAALYDEAGEAGDTAQCVTCAIALGNADATPDEVEAARAECARAIADAAARS